MSAKLTYFTARWCAPCKNLKPKVRAICESRGVEMVEVDVDDDPVRATMAGIMSVPTVVVGGVALSGPLLTPTAIRELLDGEL